LKLPTMKRQQTVLREHEQAVLLAAVLVVERVEVNRSLKEMIMIVMVSMVAGDDYPGAEEYDEPYDDEHDTSPAKDEQGMCWRCVLNTDVDLLL
jgi:hypothetical protein